MKNTKLTMVVGNHKKMKVLEFLIEGRELDYSLSDIAEGAEIGRTTLFRIWPDFEKLNFVKQTRTIGNAKMFRLNLENNSVKKLVGLFDTLIMDSLKGKERVVAV
ncbi:MAG: hypothetical protein AABX29_08085 [Nanoarchaeota archaeon]